MGIRIKPTKTTFKGDIPGVEARCTGSITLEVVFGFPDNFRSEELIFDIVPFRSGYHALLGRTAFAKFNAVPHYAYLKLKMPGPRRVITVNGNTECSLRMEEHTAALAAEVQCSLLRQFSSLAFCYLGVGYGWTFEDWQEWIHSCACSSRQVHQVD